MIEVKICGLTRRADVEAAAAAGATWVGLNFWPGSRRVVTPAQAAPLAAAARAAGLGVVGLFVDAPLDELRRVHGEVGLDRAQLHGDEPPAACAEAAGALGLAVWKAVAVGDAFAPAQLDGWPVEAVVLDAVTPGRGGSGRTIRWDLAGDAARRRRVVLAGGLTPDNVGAAVRAARPWAVDVASGVEATPGIKDAARVAAFVAAARAAAEEHDA